MRALVKAERAEGLVMRDEPIPEIGTDDILIKVRKTGICGTDLHIWKWDEWAQKTIPVPMVVGHEFSGVVEAISSSTSGGKWMALKAGIFRYSAKAPGTLTPTPLVSGSRWK